MEAASGVYSRIIFPDALSDTEPHLSEMQMAMLNATPDCIKVISPDGKLQTMNRAGCRALGVSEESCFGIDWLSLLPQEIYSAGNDALSKAAQGSVARFPGESISAEGIRYWDNLLTPLVDATGKVVSILCVSRDTTEKTRLEKQLELAVEREQLLAREMQHRIKNIFSVVSGLIGMAEREAASRANAKAVTTILREKLMALSRASDSVFSQEYKGGFNPVAANIDALVHSVLQPYVDKCAIIGHNLAIQSSAVTTLALFLHEVATNSMKYGALSTDIGRVTVSWSIVDDELKFGWTETGGPPVSAAPERRGFGTEMVDRIIRSEGGVIEWSWKSAGLNVELRLPVLVPDQPL